MFYFLLNGNDETFKITNGIGEKKLCLRICDSPLMLMQNVKKYSTLNNGILHSREKEGAYTLCNGMDGTGEHYANEISQTVRDKYHMISPLTGT